MADPRFRIQPAPIPGVCEIIAGPSREELFDALRLRREYRKVFFTVRLADGHTPPNGWPFRAGDKTTVKGFISVLGIEDLADEEWSFGLSLSATNTECAFEGSINTKTRKGWMRPK